jgi:hypothetical protein
VVLLAACTSGGGNDLLETAADAAAAAPQADAGTEGGGGGEGGNPSYKLVSCDVTGGDADAGIGDDSDAGVDEDSDGGVDEDTDAGGDVDGGSASAPLLLPGLGEECCGSLNDCADGLACLDNGKGELRCRPTCDLEVQDCGGDGLCATFGETGVCIPAQSEGEECSPQLCDGSTICVGNSADEAICRRRCESKDDCEDDQECLDLGGSASKACF